MSVWTLKGAVLIKPEPGNVIIRIPGKSTIHQLAPPRKVNSAWVGVVAGARRAGRRRRTITLPGCGVAWAPGPAHIRTRTWVSGACSSAIAWRASESRVCFHHIEHSHEPPPELRDFVIAVLYDHGKWNDRDTTNSQPLLGEANARLTKYDCASSASLSRWTRFRTCSVWHIRSWNGG